MFAYLVLICFFLLSLFSCFDCWGTMFVFCCVCLVFAACFCMLLFEFAIATFCVFVFLVFRWYLGFVLFPLCVVVFAVFFLFMPCFCRVCLVIVVLDCFPCLDAVCALMCYCYCLFLGGALFCELFCCCVASWSVCLSCIYLLLLHSLSLCVVCWGTLFFLYVSCVRRVVLYACARICCCYFLCFLYLFPFKMFLLFSLVLI